MSFDSELEAFHAYAKVMPNNSLFLVDTYDTLQGIRNAVEVGQELRDSGHNMLGVRLDSGDLAYFSIEARQILDEGGFPNASIVASNELDEEVIASLKDQGAKIDVWGVGTRLVTSYDQPALGGVYKLGAIRKADEPWRYVLKLSEQPAKTSNPGVLQVRRFRTKSEFVGDAIYNELDVPSDPVTIVDPTDPTRRKTMPADSSQEDLLIPIFRAGSRVYQPPSIHDIRRRVSDQLAALHPSVKRFLNPHGYPVGLERRLHELKTHLTLKARGFAT
jgi:nicotinate phosphoribosyltransferase